MQTSTNRTLNRSESRAYPNGTRNSPMTSLWYFCRQHSRALIATLAFVLLVIVITSDNVSPVHLRGKRQSFGLRSASGSLPESDSVHWGGAVRRGYFHSTDAIMSPTQFRFAAVTDLDELSRVPESKKPEFYSILLAGLLTKRADGRYDIHLDNDDTVKDNAVHTRKLTTKHNEAGRGGEFSELTIYENRLLTFDDRTGDVFEILNSEDGSSSICVPRFVITEGNGETDKGMKWEWATVKDGLLYMGSMGKEYTLQDGTIKNRNNLWVGILNQQGELRREDWTLNYDVVRQALGASSPGYIIVEAANWSSALKKWIFLPRRVSADAYDENLDEKRGGHQLVMLDEHFKNPKVVDIKLDSVDTLKGFSTFAFVPNSGDRHALAIRSVEDNCVNFTPLCQQRSYFIVFDVLTGEVLSDEVTYKEHVKFEGVEFVNMHVLPPPLDTVRHLL